MRMKLIAGIVLLALGVFSLVYGGVGYTSEETVIDVGPLEAKAQTREKVPIPPIVGGVVLLAGGILVFSDLKDRR